VTPGRDTRPGLSPAAEELLEGFAKSPPEPFSPRERRVELAAAASFLGAAVAMVVWLPHPDRFALEPAVVLVATYAILARIKFQIGYGYTVPTQLAFVPMLLLEPAQFAPLLVAAGILVGNLPDYLSGRTHRERVVLSFGDSWHAIGPALVLGVAGVSGPDWGDWPLYVAALAAQFALDAGTSVLREWLGPEVAPDLQPPVLGWVFLVDLLLAPIGLACAFVAVHKPAAVALALPLGALLAVFARERRERIEHALELSRAYRGTTLLLSNVLEADDEYTGLHSRSVVSLALAVADEMGLDSRERRSVEFGALLHDVGKIAVPKSIINKSGPLDDDEWLVIKTHTVEGQRMLDTVGGVLSDVGWIVRSSHERWDGTGYPDGLKGEEIPLAAAIVSACDAFNAMTTDRSYRPARPVEEALDELRAEAGRQFHPRVVDVLTVVIDGTPRGPALNSGHAQDAEVERAVGGEEAA
jgi:putative nucleotidyltransferase with HDIG domain